MSSIPLLPRVNDEKKIAFSKRGEWKSDSQNTLPNLVKDLKVTTDYKSTITSIPDLCFSIIWDVGEKCREVPMRFVTSIEMKIHIYGCSVRSS